MMAWLLWVVPSLTVALVAFYLQKNQTPNDYAVYVIGDLHGDVHCAKHWVEKTGLIDANHHWKDSTSHLVFMGDYVDKGMTAKQTLEFVKSLTDKYPHHVTALLGNHELELLLDRDSTRTVWGRGRYFQLAYASCHPGEYLNYLDDTVEDYQDEMVVQALYNASLEIYGQGQHQEVFIKPDDEQFLQYIPTELRDIVKERLAVYQTHYMDTFRTGSPLGSWLEQRPIVALQNGVLLVHGGVSRSAAKHLSTLGVDGINELYRNHATEDRLKSFMESTSEGRAMYDLLVYRGNHHESACPHLSELLPDGATRLGVGHTPDYNVRTSLCTNNTFLALDSSLSRYFRNSGNDYCRGDARQKSSNGKYACYRTNPQCQGQIVRLVNDKVEIIE